MSNFFFVARNPRGTHSLQVFIENLEDPLFKEILSALIEKENPLFFAFNKHATHVLIKYIELTPENPYLVGLYTTITANLSSLSQDANGLPLVKLCLAKIRAANFKQDMIDQFCDNAI